MSKPLPRRQVYLTLLLLGAVTYYPVLRTGFLWDDHVLIEQNPYIQSWSAANFKHDFSSTVSNGVGDAGFLRPVVTLSNRLDYSVWGMHPFGFHLTSLCLHLANALLVYEFVLVLGCTPMAALLTAVLFVVHPIGVEGLLAVTGRATFLSFFFAMITLLLMAEPSPWRLCLGLFTCVLALFSKEESVVIPLMLPLLWIARQEFKKRWIWLMPFLALTGAYLAYRRYVFGAVGAPSDLAYTLRFFMEAFPRILTHYVRLIVFPWNLHSHRLILRLSHFWFLSLAGWIALAVVSGLQCKTYPRFFFCVYWLAIGLFPPAAAMVYGGFMLDHWGYWIAPAVLIPMGIVFDALWSDRRYARYSKFSALYFVAVIGYALLVRLNIELRNTDEKMYRWALHFTTSHPIKYNLGSLLLQSGRAEEAIPYFQDVQAAYPEDSNNSYLLAMAFNATGHPRTAIRMLEDLLKQNPTHQLAIDSLRDLKRKNNLPRQK